MKQLIIQNKIPLIPLEADQEHWKLFFNIHNKKAKIGDLKVLGDFQVYNNELYCPFCQSKKWKPKILGSIDVGYILLYYCECKKSFFRAYE